MKKRLFILIITSLLLSGCAAQSYSAAGSGVYLGNAAYSQSNLGISSAYSRAGGWYGYPWFSAAYQRPTHFGLWPGYITAGHGFGGGYYGGFSGNWGYFYPSPYYAYSGWGYNPYYGYRYRGYRPYRGHGPYRHVHNPHAGYAHASYRNNRRPHYSGQQHYNYNGFEHDRRERNRHAGNGQRPHPRDATQPVIHQPVRIIRMPEHRSEAAQPVARSGRAAANVRSRSGNLGWKGEHPPRQKIHQTTGKHSKSKSTRVVKIVHKQARVVEAGAGYTPPRPYSAQRSASGPNRHKAGTPPRQKLHSGSVKAPSQQPMAQTAPVKQTVAKQHVRSQSVVKKSKKPGHKAGKSHKSYSGKSHKKSGHTSGRSHKSYSRKPH